MNGNRVDLLMVILEFVVTVGAVALVLARWVPQRLRRPVTAVAALTVVLGAVALAVVEVRWHMTLVLVGAGLAGVFAAAPMLRRRTARPAWRARWWLALPGSLACLSLIAAGTVAALTLPVPTFPKLTGHHRVGTTVMEWTDQQRPEPATEAPDDRRSIVVQLWYPAADTPAVQAPYLGRTRQEARAVSDGLAAYLGAPGFLLDNLSRGRTLAGVDAALASGSERYPVVLFSPGLGGVRTQNTAWAQELASRGFVVVGVDHPYDSAAVMLSDGRMISTRIAATGDPVEDGQSAAGWTAVRAADLSFALTQLERLDRGELIARFARRLDTGRVAATGHSLGGAAALQAARLDPRFKAAIDLDGFPHGPSELPLRRPVLAMTNGTAPQDNPEYIVRLSAILEQGTATSYQLTVPDAAHLTFTDAPLFLPPVPALVGSLGRVPGVRLTADVSAAFLDVTLRGSPDDLPSLLATHGELTVHPGRR